MTKSSAGLILGEGFQSLPVGDPLDDDNRLGDGVLLDIEVQSGDPLDEAAVARSGEGGCEGWEQALPERPEEGSLPDRASPDADLMEW